MGVDKRKLKTAVATDPLLTAKEAGIELDCTVMTVYRLAKSGELEYVRAGRRGRGWRFLKSSVISLAKRGS